MAWQPTLQPRATMRKSTTFDINHHNSTQLTAHIHDDWTCHQRKATNVAKDRSIRNIHWHGCSHLAPWRLPWNTIYWQRKPCLMQAVFNATQNALKLRQTSGKKCDSITKEQKWHCPSIKNHVSPFSFLITFPHRIQYESQKRYEQHRRIFATLRDGLNYTEKITINSTSTWVHYNGSQLA